MKIKSKDINYMAQEILTSLVDNNRRSLEAEMIDSLEKYYLEGYTNKELISAQGKIMKAINKKIAKKGIFL
jgi:hypothetical protein